MPTPAARATASRLASAPPVLKTTLAASSTRSRLRSASTRGFRVFFSLFGSRMPICPMPALEKRRRPPYIAIYLRQTIALSHKCRRIRAHSIRNSTKVFFRTTRPLQHRFCQTGTTADQPLMEHSMGFSTTLTVNGVKRTIALDDPRVTLLDLLRERLELTGTKKGCDRGQCGACTVILDGRRINSCLALAISHDGADVLTIEGVAQGNRLHPVQEAFIAHDGLQCGFCTPGQIMSAIGLIQEGEAGDDPERVREGMSGNLCRCSAYLGITEAVLEAQKVLDTASQREVA